MTCKEAAQTMTLSEYRLWWYSELKLTPPEPGEHLTVRQRTDERLIREGYNYHNGRPINENEHEHDNKNETVSRARETKSTSA